MPYEAKSLMHDDVGVVQKYEPIIQEYFNNQISFYAKSPKKTVNQINHGFAARVTRNQKVGATDSVTTITGGSSGRIYLYNHLRQYYGAVSIEDARVLEAKKNGLGPLTDAWASEFESTLIDLSKCLNQDFLNGSGTLGAAFGDPVDSLAAILDTTGSIYGASRSTYPALAANVDASVGDLTLGKLRSYITTLKEKGATNLVIWTTPTIVTYIKNKMEQQKMYPSTSSQAGFEGQLTFDSVPIMEDADIDIGFMYILDRDSYYIAEFLPFTMGVEALAKTTLMTDKYIWGILNLEFTKINTSYKLSGITS